MDKKRLLKLAEVLESDEAAKHFDMESFYDDGAGNLPNVRVGEFIHRCGSVACIAGWAVATFDPKRTTRDDTLGLATALLGLNSQQAHRLFVPGEERGCDEFSDRTRRSVYDATAAEAAKVVRHLAETGEVDWSKGLE
jgi:hypothetical protein